MELFYLSWLISYVSHEHGVNRWLQSTMKLKKAKQNITKKRTVKCENIISNIYYWSLVCPNTFWKIISLDKAKINFMIRKLHLWYTLWEAVPFQIFFRYALWGKSGNYDNYINVQNYLIKYFYYSVQRLWLFPSKCLEDNIC